MIEPQVTCWECPDCGETLCGGSHECATPTGGARVPNAVWLKLSNPDPAGYERQRDSPIMMLDVPGIKAVAAEMERQGEGADAVVLPRDTWIRICSLLAEHKWPLFHEDARSIIAQLRPIEAAQQELEVDE